MHFLAHGGTEPRASCHLSAWKWLKRAWPEGTADKEKRSMASVAQRVRVDCGLPESPQRGFKPCCFRTYIQSPQAACLRVS